MIERFFRHNGLRPFSQKVQIKIEVAVNAKDAKLVQDAAEQVPGALLVAKGYLIRAEKNRDDLAPVISLGKDVLEGLAVTTKGNQISIKSQNSLARLAAALPSGEAIVPAESLDLYKRLLFSVVWIRNSAASSEGTGTLIDARNRTVLTCNHVVGDAREVWVMFPFAKEGKLVAEKDAYVAALRTGHGIRGQVVGKDAKRDLAILRLDSLPKGYLPLSLAAESAIPTQAVHSIGNPAVGALWIYTKGTVRQVVRRQMKLIETHSDIDARLILTDSPINPGDSGGPLVNDRGELLGVTQSIIQDVRKTSAFVDISEVEAFLTSQGVKPNK